MDATFGQGGHTRAILDQVPGSRVMAIDRDASAFESDVAQRLQEQHRGRLSVHVGSFGLAHELLASEFILFGFRSQRRRGRHIVPPPLACLDSDAVGNVDGVLMDLGLSSWQLSQPARGFSFLPSAVGPLDMRMAQVRKGGLSF